MWALAIVNPHEVVEAFLLLELRGKIVVAASIQGQQPDSSRLLSLMLCGEPSPVGSR
jgi:hypothetical protein